MELLLLYSSWLLLLLLSSQGLHSTEGRTTLHHSQLKEPPQKMEQKAAAAAMSAALIGSRPPRCEGKCATCGRCEAVQVPVSPQDKRHFRLFGVGAFGVGGGGGGRVVDESFTNYKPLNWKCRCADTRILNP